MILGPFQQSLGFGWAFSAPKCYFSHETDYTVNWVLALLRLEQYSINSIPSEQMAIQIHVNSAQRGSHVSLLDVM